MRHPQAVVSEGVRLGRDVRIEPGAVVEDGAELGDGVVVGACAYVGPGVVIGTESSIGPGAVLLRGVKLGAGCVVEAGAVLGSRGFGFVQVDGAHRDIPQVGGVSVGDGSFLGSSCCVDRGTTGDTVLGKRVRVGALAQVAHNCQIGDDVEIGPRTGVAGSSSLGEGCRLGAQAGVTGHSQVGAGTRLADLAGVTRKKVPADSDLSGFPARPTAEYEAVQEALDRLPELIKKLEARQA